MTLHSVIKSILIHFICLAGLGIGACEKETNQTPEISFQKLILAADSCYKSTDIDSCLATLITPSSSPVWQNYIHASIKIRQQQQVEAYQLINDVLPLTENPNQLYERAKLFELRSSIHFNHNEREKGAEDLFEAIDIFIALNKHREAAHCLVGMANVQFNSQNYDLANENAELAVKHYELEKNLMRTDSAYLMNVYNTLGLTCFKLNKLNEATEHYHHALILAQNLKEEFWTALIHGNAAHIDVANGRLDEAIGKLQNDVRISLKHGEIRSAASSYLSIGEIFQKKNKHAISKEYYDSALHLYAKHNIKEVDPKYYKQMADWYDAKGEGTKAYVYLKTYLNVRDSVLAKKNSLLLQQLQNQKVFEKQLNDINLLAAKNKLKEEELRIREVSIVAFILILLLLILLIFNIRRNNAALRNLNNSLEIKVKQRMASILKLNKELDTYLYRASHDIRGPILSIQGLVHLVNYSNTREEAVELVTKIEQTARTMDAMLLKLQMAYELNFRKEYEDVNVSDLILSLINSLQENYPAAVFKLECDPELKVYTNLYHLSVAIRNIMENACIFHNPDHPVNQVYLRVTTTTHLLQIRIQDNGIGIPENYLDKIFEAFQRFSIHSKGNGMGLYISHKAITNLNGKIEVSSRENAGTTFTITIPATT